MRWGVGLVPAGVSSFFPSWASVLSLGLWLETAVSEKLVLEGYLLVEIIMFSTVMVEED
jgi:hypothetical protein